MSTTENCGKARRRGVEGIKGWPHGEGDVWVSRDWISPCPFTPGESGILWRVLGEVTQSDFCWRRSLWLLCRKRTRRGRMGEPSVVTPQARRYGGGGGGGRWLASRCLKVKLSVFGVGLDVGLERKTTYHRWLPLVGLRSRGLAFVLKALESSLSSLLENHNKNNFSEVRDNYVLWAFVE